MIDIHSHIIKEIDDGARNLEESITILEKLSKIGFTHIVATPHYITGSRYICNNSSKVAKLEMLDKYKEEKRIPIHLYLGNEVFIDPNIIPLLKQNEITTINGSRYILIELPVSRPMNEMMDILFYFRSRDYVPIIAHPERYLYLQENHQLIDTFLKMGCLFQGNFSNITEKYGAHAKKLFLYMLKNNKYQFLATDVHHKEDSLFTNMRKVKKEIIKLTSKEKFEELTYLNPLKVLKDENIDIKSEEDYK